jgi:hypothetical protein
VFYGNLRFHEKVLSIGLEDDFFYYAHAARNLVFNGHSTFDGTHITNGYHPLWFLIIAAITKVFSIGGLGHASTIYPFAIALETIQVSLVLGVAYISYKFTSKFCDEAICLCIQLLITSWMIIQVRTGMEVGLAILMVFLLMLFRVREGFQWNFNNSLVYGLIAALAILSRLDVVLIVAPTVAIDLLFSDQSIRSKIKNCFGVAIGLLPLFGYFASNIVLFHVLMPISGTAKQLRTHHVPSWNALQTFIEYITSQRHPLLGIFMATTAIAVIRYRTLFKRVYKYRTIFLGTLLFPIVHLVVICSASDWLFFPWYLYPWIISFLSAATILFARPTTRNSEPAYLPDPQKREGWVYACAAFMFFYSFAISFHSNPKHNLPYMASMAILKFEKSHPGIYAMGDRAGVVGYFGTEPVVQLEGLMMDPAFLQHIIKKEDLVKVLHQYDVKYYVSTRAAVDENGCWTVKEPFQAGPDSPAMHGTLCNKPVAEFTNGDFTNDIFYIGE